MASMKVVDRGDNAGNAGAASSSLFPAVDANGRPLVGSGPRLSWSVDRVVELFRAVDGSTMVTHIEIADVCKVPYRVDGRTNGEYSAVMLRAKRILKRDFGIFISSVIRQGYQVSPLGKEIDVIGRDVKAGVKRIARAVVDTNHIRVHLLSDVDRAHTVAESQKMAWYLKQLSAKE